MPARDVLVTGGSGFVGSHVVDLLLEAGNHVRCLIRAGSRMRWLEGKPVETVQADLRDGDLAPAVADIDCVIHCAGLTRGSADSLRAANVEGTRALIRACVRAGSVARFVFCSSQAAAGPGRLDRRRRLDDPPAPNSEYGRSKLQAEAEVRAAEDVLEIVILRPGAVYGPRDEDTLPFFRMAASGIVLVPGWGRRLVQLVHVRDVARALSLATVTPHVAGRTYFVAHPRVVSWGELAAATGRALRRPIRTLPLPSSAFRVAGLLSEVLGGARRAGGLDRRRARDMVERAWTCDVEATLEELGWVPRFDLDEGLEDTVRWYRKEGWL
jgi:nucleoside-diphosphate-sugar epimerase